LRYIEGVKIADIPWQDFEAKKVKLAKWGCIPGPGEAWPIQRSAALGKEMHARWERYYAPQSERAPIVWTDLIGQIMVSGKHLLPRREHCQVVHVEQPLGDRLLKWNRRGEDRENLVWDIDFGDSPVTWNGYKDLVVRITREECERLGCYWTDGYLLIDHKTTSSIAQYAKVNALLRVQGDERTDLRDDLQCCLYALEVMTRYGLTSLAVRWVYYETKDKRQAVAVDELITLEHAWEIVDEGCRRAKLLERIRSLSDAKYNTEACQDFGGCKMHVEYGGPCTARRPLRSLVKGSRKKADKQAMASILELRAKQKAKATELRKSEPPPAAEVDEAEIAALEVAAEDDAPKPKATRKPRATTRVVPEALPEPEPEPEAEPDEQPLTCDDYWTGLSLLELAHKLETNQAEGTAIRAAIKWHAESL
jgi:hypothetical protein